MLLSGGSRASVQGEALCPGGDGLLFCVPSSWFWSVFGHLMTQQPLWREGCTVLAASTARSDKRACCPARSSLQM